MPSGYLMTFMRWSLTKTYELDQSKNYIVDLITSITNSLFYFLIPITFVFNINLLTVECTHKYREDEQKRNRSIRLN